MNRILSAIRSFFNGEFLPGGELSPKLRNRAGGMAWVRRTAAPGAEVLYGRFVTTKRLNAHGNWEIEPKLQFKVTVDFSAHGELHRAGSIVQVVGICDDNLEPIPDTGIKREEVEYLFSTELIPLRVREMTRE